MKEQLDRILAKLDSMELKLDKVIKAMQEYDGVDEDFNEPEDEYAWENINSAEAEKYNRLLDEAEANKRLDVIGQNGNEGLHYDKEKVVKAAREFGKKKAAEVKEYLKDATIPDIPKPKKKYYHSKKKKDGNNKKSS